MAEIHVKRKPVQEPLEDGIQFPDEYIWEDANYGVIDASAPLAEIPIIDITCLNNTEKLDKLQSALASWRCFQAINHGIENSFLEKLREVARQFYHLPMIEKQKYAREAGEIDGYGNDMILLEDQTLDWYDRLMLLDLPENERELKYWPENPLSFRIQQIEERILKSMAKSLNIEEECFLKQNRRMATQFNYYPPCPKPDCVLGLNPHSDATTITILLQDEEVEGLQVMKDDKWFRVPVIPCALLVNVGDQIEIMSNGIFKRPVHRVLTNSKKERSTLAMFCASEAGKEIEPVGALPRMYKAVKDYHETYDYYYQQGKRAIDSVKI